MCNFKVNFYIDEDGSVPVSEFINSLDVKMKAKVITNLQLLEEYGYLSREPLSRHLEDDIFELRCKVGSNIVRILYFFDKDQIIIATNGFVKKQQKAPRREIALAKKRRALYMERKSRSCRKEK